MEDGGELVDAIYFIEIKFENCTENKWPKHARKDRIFSQQQTGKIHSVNMFRNTTLCVLNQALEYLWFLRYDIMIIWYNKYIAKISLVYFLVLCETRYWTHME